jgi:hypothetical protein
MFSRRGAENAGMGCFFSNVSINLFVFLCGLCASARVNICSLICIANPGCKGKTPGLSLG